MNLLSIQSHVVHGYVGNKAATFPLQLRGWNVDCINTTNFSNHPGYKKFSGTKTPKNEILKVFEGIADFPYQTILMGYLPDDQSLKAVCQMVSEYCMRNKGTLWVLDPVLGDNGRMYVDRSLVPAYKWVLQNFDIDLVTPNQFELEMLTGIQITNFASLYESLQLFHENFCIKHVVVTSISLPHQESSIYCVGSTAGEGRWVFKSPIIDAVFSGSGDLFGAILTDSFFNHRARSDALRWAIGETIEVVRKVLMLTYEKSQTTTRTIQGKMYMPDLKLIESRDILLEETHDVDYYIQDV